MTIKDIESDSLHQLVSIDLSIHADKEHNVVMQSKEYGFTSNAIEKVMLFQDEKTKQTILELLDKDMDKSDMADSLIDIFTKAFSE